jgi:hypothetical protein
VKEWGPTSRQFTQPLENGTQRGGCPQFFTTSQAN